MFSFGRTAVIVVLTYKFHYQLCFLSLGILDEHTLNLRSTQGLEDEGPRLVTEQSDLSRTRSGGIKRAFGATTEEEITGSDTDFSQNDGDDVDLDYKKRAVEYCRSGEKTRRTLTSIQTKYRKVKSMCQLER